MCEHGRQEWIDGNATFDEFKCLSCGEEIIQYVENSGC